MSELIPLHKIVFDRAPDPSSDLGTRGELCWLALDDLVIDTRYQRPITGRGVRNIRRIIETFRWDMFSPLIVGPRDGGKFAVIDGQHRSIAAFMHPDIVEVPSFVIAGGEAEEARAFAVINGQVTAVLPTQIFYARLVAGDADAIALQDACHAAGVKIMKTARQRYKVGQTIAVRALELCLERFGRNLLITALMCITETGDGNPGMVRAPIIYGLCGALKQRPTWIEKPGQLFEIIDHVSIPRIYNVAAVNKAEHDGNLAGHVERLLVKALDRVKQGEGRAA